MSSYSLKISRDLNFNILDFDTIIKCGTLRVTVTAVIIRENCGFCTAIMILSCSIVMLQIISYLLLDVRQGGLLINSAADGCYTQTVHLNVSLISGNGWKHNYYAFLQHPVFHAIHNTWAWGPPPRPQSLQLHLVRMRKWKPRLFIMNDTTYPISH